MMKLEVSVTLALVLCSAAAFAREPEALALGAAAALDADQPRSLHYRPIESEVPDQPTSVSPQPSASQAASDGQLSVFTSAAVISNARVNAQSYVGYDSAISLARARGAAEGRLTPFLALRMEFEHGPATGAADRVSIGARLGILTQRKYGVDLGAGLYYQPKDFRGEGNIVGAMMLARHFENLGVFANALFGSDPEGDDQLLELRLGSLYAVGDWLRVGVDARSRLNFSQDQKRLQANRVDWEMQAAPTAIFCVGQLSLMALAGPSFVRETPAAGVSARDGRTHGGLLAMAGAGGAF